MLFKKLLKNNVTEFDLDSVPEVFKKSWEAENIRGELDLESAQLSAQLEKKTWWRWTVAHILLVIPVFILLGSLTLFPIFSVKWLGVILSGCLVTFLLRVSNLYFLPPIKFELMEDFISDYGKLQHLLYNKWGYQYIDSEIKKTGEGWQDTVFAFELTEKFVRRNLVEFNQMIKNNKESTIKRVRGDSRKSVAELEQEFADDFSTLKSFGLVSDSGQYSIQEVPVAH